MAEAPIKYEMPKAYEPGKVEQKWYKFWLEKGYFTPKIDPKKKPFVIIMPLPNVTGELHIGHALTAHPGRYHDPLASDERRAYTVAARS